MKHINKFFIQMLFVFVLFIPVLMMSQSNYSLSFDGNGDYVEINDSDILSPTDFTLELWVKQSQLTSGRNTYVFKADGTTSQEYSFMENTDGLYSYIGSGSYVSSAHPTDDQWTHIAATFNSNTGLLEIFVNGTSVGTGGVTTGVVNTDGKLYLGWKPTSPDYNALTGIIDEVRISNTVRYTSDFTIPSVEFTSDDNTVALYHLNEGTGTTITDVSGNGNDGTIHGASWSTDTPTLTTSGLIAYYPFNGNANDESGNGNDGTVNGAILTTDRFGNTSSAYSFDGVEDYIEVNATVIPNSGEFTVVVWANAVPSQTGLREILSQDAGTGTINFYLGKTTNNTIRLSDDWQNTGVGFPLDNQWHLYTAVKTADNTFLYLDTNLVAIRGSAILNPIGNEFRIGRQYGNYGEYFDGAIDDIRIYNRALTASEIQTLYNENVETWNIQIQSLINTLSDNYNYIGVSGYATNGFDTNYDEVEPPSSPSGSISLYFPHPEWNNILGDNFSKDIRPEIVLSDTMQVWDFRVKSTDAGSCTLTFVYTNVPSVPVILENVGTTERQSLTNNSTYTFTTVADSAHQFKISIGDTTSPSLTLGLSCSGPSILISDSTQKLNWTTTDGFEVDSVKVYFSSDSGTTYSLVSKLGGASSYDWTVPDAEVIYGGKIKVKSQDYVGNYTEKVSDYVFAVVGDSISSNVDVGWNLWGVPINPTNNTMETNLSDDFTDYWVTYDYVNNGYTYDGILKETEGYWLGTLQNATIDIKGTPLNSNTTMYLSQGWDLISNPLVLDVSVDSLTFTKNSVTLSHSNAVDSGWVNSIYKYDGSGYVFSNVFEPWNGYWIGVLEDSVSMTFPIHRHDTGSSRNRQRIQQDVGWWISFEASTENSQDITTIIGVDESGNDVFDNQLDAVKPPLSPSPEYVSLNIPHPEWNHPLGNDFAKDIRSIIPNGESKDWIIVVESSESEVVVEWEIEYIPDEYEVGIDTDGDGQFEDMRIMEELTLSDGSQFTVRIGSNVLGIDDGNLIPEVFSLHQNYPNPFNPITTIRYDLPEMANVQLTIYDLLGREVRTLVNGVQEPGFKSVVWDASRVGSGIYFYRISAGSSGEAGEYTETKKCLILK